MHMQVPRLGDAVQIMEELLVPSRRRDEDMARIA
jgi:hypothetical protein